MGWMVKLSGESDNLKQTSTVDVLMKQQRRVFNKHLLRLQHHTKLWMQLTLPAHL